MSQVVWYIYAMLIISNRWFLSGNRCAMSQVPRSRVGSTWSTRQNFVQVLTLPFISPLCVPLRRICLFFVSPSDVAVCCMKPVLFTAVLLRCFLSDCGLIFVYLDLCMIFSVFSYRDCGVRLGGVLLAVECWWVWGMQLMLSEHPWQVSWQCPWEIPTGSYCPVFLMFGHPLDIIFPY